MKHLTFALAAVMLPLISKAYQVMPLGIKKIKIVNERGETSGLKKRDFIYLRVPPGTTRVVYSIAVHDKMYPKTIGLSSQLEDLLSGPADPNVAAYMVESKKGPIGLNIRCFDELGCAYQFLRYGDDCLPLTTFFQSKGGTFDVPWSPSLGEANYFICINSTSPFPESYLTIEAVAILN